MAEIQLSNGLISEVDDEDLNVILTFSPSWHCRKGHKTNYAVSCHRKIVNGKRSFKSIHRLIMEVKKGQYVDHINGDGLDNRKSNLRICTNSQNGGNATKRITAKTSEYKGVYFNKRKNIWMVRVSTTYVGVYRTEVEAAEAYNNAAIKVYGQFALLNKINKMQ